MNQQRHHQRRAHTVPTRDRHVCALARPPLIVRIFKTLFFRRLICLVSRSIVAETTPRPVDNTEPTDGKTPLFRVIEDPRKARRRAEAERLAAIGQQQEVGKEH